MRAVAAEVIQLQLLQQQEKREMRMLVEDEVKCEECGAPMRSRSQDSSLS